MAGAPGKNRPRARASRAHRRVVVPAGQVQEAMHQQEIHLERDRHADPPRLTLSRLRRDHYLAEEAMMVPSS